MNNETSSVAGFRIVLILVAIGAAVFLAIRIPKLVFRNDIEDGAAQCAKDGQYYFKDPKNHPYAC